MIVVSKSGGMVMEEMNADRTGGDVSDGIVTEKMNTDKLDGGVLGRKGVNKERICGRGGDGKAMDKCASR